jgi:hypothetical protein
MLKKVVHEELKELQLLTFESGPACDLAKAHGYCPTNYREHGATLATDDQKVNFAKACRDWGFSGMVAYHYYNEPLLYSDQIMTLAKRMKDEVGLESLLWTNGTKLTDELLKELVSFFNKIMVTLHYPDKESQYQQWVLKYPGQFHVKPGGHDERGNVYNQRAKPRRYLPCYRPAEGEMPIDCWGEVHLCCIDWNAHEKLGNITTDWHEGIIRGWVKKAQLATTCSLGVCRKCQSLSRKAFIPNRGNKF